MIEQKVTIAPLVLLSAVDHYKRLSTTRVVGVLLGSSDSKAINITNSFAIPFEESNGKFFIDTSYLQNMFELFYKVNCKEKIMGWYHSGPKMYKSDLEISKAMKKYCENPLLAVINVHLDTDDIPAQVFKLCHNQEFVHMKVQIGAEETEEVGVEHLLRDIKEGTGRSLKDKVLEIYSSLKMYKSALDNIIEYLTDAENGKKTDNKIIELFQEILNDVPRFESSADLSELYKIELTNSVIAMNDLIRNKIDMN
jgi:26S proteasome regulatory subunit N8